MDPETVIRVFYQACRAVQHLHVQEPPINHRDIKVSSLHLANKSNFLNYFFLFLNQIENFLLGCDGVLKLCDFGSATTISHEPDFNWSAQQRDLLIDHVSLSELKTSWHSLFSF